MGIGNSELGILRVGSIKSWEYWELEVLRVGITGSWEYWELGILGVGDIERGVLCVGSIVESIVNWEY